MVDLLSICIFARQALIKLYLRAKLSLYLFLTRPSRREKRFICYVTKCREAKPRVALLLFYRLLLLHALGYCASSRIVSVRGPLDIAPSTVTSAMGAAPDGLRPKRNRKQTSKAIKLTKR